MLRLWLTFTAVSKLAWLKTTSVWHTVVTKKKNHRTCCRFLLTVHPNGDSLEHGGRNTAELCWVFGPGRRSALEPAGFTGSEPWRWAMATVHFLTHWPHLLHFTMRNKRGPILASSQWRGRNKPAFRGELAAHWCTPCTDALQRQALNPKVHPTSK